MTTVASDILQALDRLDPENPDHWTADGMPRVDVVSEFVGRNVTRGEIVEDSPTFTQEAAATALETGVHHMEGAEVEEPIEVIPNETIPVPEMDVTEVGIEDNVVGMDPSAVLVDVELMDRAITEFTRQSTLLSRRKVAIERALAEVSQRCQLVSRHRERSVTPEQRRTERQEEIKRYQDRQNEARAGRVQRARAFVEGGTTAGDVARELGGPSTIDSAMKAKRARGGQRPQYPLKPRPDPAPTE